MATLHIFQDGKCREFSFSPPLSLEAALEQVGLTLSRPCGGRGACGKCAVTLYGGVSAPNGAEIKAGTRLACQAMLLDDAEVHLPNALRGEQIQTSGAEVLTAFDPMAGRLGVAVDIGTTTLALKLCELESGKVLSDAAMVNPQTSIAADVMGRISAAMDGELDKMQRQLLRAIASLSDQACESAGCSLDEVDVLVLTGNTTMLYLLTGRDPQCLSHAPFRADTLFDTQAEILSRRAYLPPCMNAFVGADITCAVLASGMCNSCGTVLLCDIGTNGEIALWKGGALYVTSTAAGPAFEGAGISCGCGSVTGAIDRVWTENGVIQVHTIGDAPAVGICGSGLIDAIAVFLKIQEIDETGATESDSLPLGDGIALLPQDVRAVQLAKAAIAAGIETLLETANIALKDVETLYIAGGFGSHLSVASAAAIGLIPRELAQRVQMIGNAALSGAVQMLRSRSSVNAAREIASRAVHLNLGGNPRFNEHYMEQMLFPDEL